MNLELGVLWIEDDPSEAQEQALRQAAADAGFEADITVIESGADLDAIGAEQQLYHPFDLVLLDLKLADGDKGDELAQRVRQHFRSTPILFYSGSCEEPELRALMAEREVEGVFCSHRRNFVVRAAEMISDLAASLNRLSGMRGLAMSVVSEADLLCREVVLALGEKVDVEASKKRLDKAVTKSNGGVVEEFTNLTDLAERLEHRAVDTMNIFNEFKELTRRYAAQLESGEQKDWIQAKREETRNFRSDVLEVRNTLGHALEKRTDKGWAIVDQNDDVVVSVQDFPKLRRDFLLNLEAIRALHGHLINN